MGIGLKGVKQKFSCSSKIEDYSTSNKTPTPKKYHKWIEEEVQGLSEISIPGVKKIPIAEPQTEVDVLGKECFDKIYDLLAKTKAYKLISKFENTMAKLSSYSSNSHDDLIIIPIKITTIDNNTVFYGVLIKSHSHLRSDNDRVNVLTIEFLKEFKEDFKIKYPKHNIFKFKNQNLFLAVRLNATWPLKMFYHSTSKRSIIPIINGVNRVWFSHMAKEQKYSELDTTMNVEMSEGTISFSDWIRRIFSIHVQMAIGNDSQLEAFCADIRRMQMFTRVLQSSESHLYILKGGKPENKVAESVINNPLVLYLKEAWNHHCEGFNEEIKLRVQNAEKNRSLKRQASNSDGRAASTSKT
uniref:PA n=1 Tax=Goettingen orthomyxo-like virus TaxID=2789610 RepID=A0A7S8ZXA3_9ORTO|nr:PA [Goettingen orthomyxo-like virus]